MNDDGTMIQGEEEDIGAKYGNQKLNMKVRTKEGKEMRVFTATEASGTLTLRCEVCSMTFFGLNNLDIHVNGRRHRSEMDVFADNNSIDPEPVEAFDSGTFIVPTSRCMLLKQMEHYDEFPVIGLEYMVEIQKGGYDPDIHCLLCEKSMDIRSSVGHIISSTHRLRYLECFFPVARRQFAKVPNLSFWERPSYDFLESVIRRIEDKHGRLKPFTVDSNKSFNKNLPDIKATIENGFHFKQTDELIFASLPDPFGSYLHQIPRDEIVKIDSLPVPKPMPALKVDLGSKNLINDTGLEDVEDPEMKEYYKSEIEKFREKELGSRDDNNTDQVMSKIANLRREIAAEKKMASYRQSNKALREKTAELDDISDDELQVENNADQLQGKLRRPQGLWKGIQSRNPGDSASRRDRADRENSQRDRDDREKIKLRDPTRERLGSPRGRDRDARDRDMRDRELRDRDVRDRDVRDREMRDRDVRERDRRDRDREVRRSPPRRSSREKERKRPRSVSPFVTAMESFKKFKKEEKVMLDGINRKKEIYEKRPEDHPKYPEEWRMFWEKRYKELLVQGQDPNTHDFKSEWIPFWTKRVVELFDVLVLEKTADLLKKYDLTSVEEPKRQDYKRPSPERPAKRIEEDIDRHQSSGRRRSVSPRKESPIRRDRGGSLSPARRDRRGSPSPGRRGRRGSGSPGRRDRRGSGSPFRKDRRGSPGRRDLRVSRSPGRRDLRGSGSPGRRDLRGSRSPGRRDRRGSRSPCRRDRIVSPRDRRGSPSDRRVSSISPGRRDRRGNVRNPSPPHHNMRDIPDKGRTGPSRLHSSHSLYSGLTALEDKRDRGRSRSPRRYRSPSPPRNGIDRGHEFHRMDDPQMGVVKVIPCLRLLTALEDSLGSLGPQVNSILARALSLEQGREGASKVLLEDPDTVSIMDMIKEKLSGQMAAGLLQGSKEGAVRVCLDNLARLLQNATRKRSLQPTSLLGFGARDSPIAGGSTCSNSLATDGAIKELIAKSVATALIQSGNADISDYDLQKLIEDLMKVTATDDPNSYIGKLANVFSSSTSIEPLKPLFSAIDSMEPPKSQANIVLQAQDMPGLPQNLKTKPKEQFFDDSDMDPRNDVVGPAYVTPMYKADGEDQQTPPEPADELDDLTIDELRSLLDNFKNLSKSEQMDLIQYMRKLEVTNPAKVKQLKTRVGPTSKPSSTIGNTTIDEGNSRNKSNWSPVRSRRMSVDDMTGMNPSGPEPGPVIEVVDMELEGDTLEDEEELAVIKEDDRHSQLSDGRQTGKNEDDRHSHLSGASGGKKSTVGNSYGTECRTGMNSDMPSINPLRSMEGLNSGMGGMGGMNNGMGTMGAMNSDMLPINSMRSIDGMNSEMEGMSGMNRGIGGRGMNTEIGVLGGMGTGQIINPMFVEVNRGNLRGNINRGNMVGNMNNIGNGPWESGGFC